MVAQGEYEIAPGISAYGELLYVDRDFYAPAEPPALRGVAVPRTNPYNPFDADVLVDVLLIDLGPRMLTRSSEMIRAGGGVRGRMNSWDWELSVHEGQDKDHSVRTNDLDPALVAAALAATQTDETLNVFGGRNSNNPELLGSLLAAPSRNRSRLEMRQATAYLRGSLLSLPAGSVDLVVGGEQRKESLQYDFEPPANTSGSHQRTVTAAFGELRLPLMGAAAKIPAVHDLWLVLSARGDDYSDVGSSLNPEYSLTWRPIPALSLRTSWSQSFRPPPLFDLYQPPVDIVAPTVDPSRNDELAFPIWRAGGNSRLEPSTADSLTTSIRFSPPGKYGLRIGATYWRIHVDETIGIPQAAHLLAAESSFTDRVVRREPSDMDIAAGLPGPLELIDITRLNHGSIRTSGLDFSSSMDFDTRVGRFKPDLTATWVHDYTTSDLAVGPDIRRVGVADLQGTIVRWRAVASLNWSYQGWGAFGALRYIPSYDDVDSLRQSGSRKVGSQALVDFNLSMDLSYMVAPGSPWDGFELRAGVSNLFDHAPPFAEVGLLMGFDPSQGDLKQRFTYLKLSKRF
jgi:iron complex outermembrane receptor protein